MFIFGLMDLSVPTLFLMFSSGINCSITDPPHGHLLHFVMTYLDIDVGQSLLFCYFLIIFVVVWA